jgi:site-specific recombinase XerD
MTYLPDAPRGPTGMGPPDVKVPAADGGRTPRNLEDMRHPTHVWTDSAIAEEPLERLLAEYERHIGSGPNKLSPRTQRKYMQDLRDFLRSVEKHEMEAVLGSVTPASVSLWTGDQEERGNVVDSIAVRVISLKTFTSKYVWKTLELTNVDLLRKVARPNPKPKPRNVLTDAEIEHLLAVYDGDTFEEVRDRGQFSPRWR